MQNSAQATHACTDDICDTRLTHDGTHGIQPKICMKSPSSTPAGRCTDGRHRAPRGISLMHFVVPLV